MSEQMAVTLPPPFPNDGVGTVLTIGTFDGVHLGHREVLAHTAARAIETGRRSVVVTFHPHPLRVVRPASAPALLTTLEEKKMVLAGSGVRHAVFLPFTTVLQSYSARRFVEEILLARYRVEELVLGYDHGFGRGREGSVETMRSLGAELGFEVRIVEPLHISGQPVSSTRIRDAVGSGDVVEAARCLGRAYALRGPVVRGERRGRQLGFPTANIQILDAEKLLPAPGIYAAHGLVQGHRIPGLLHLGPRPTFPGSPPSIELYLLDWSGDLYGQTVEVHLCTRIREIAPFHSAAALVAQMRRDEAHARALFEGGAGPSGCVPMPDGL